MVLSLIKLSLTAIVTIALAWALYGYNFFLIGLALVPFVANLIVLGWSIGIVTTAIILRFGQKAEVMAWGLAFLFQPFSAVFYPVSVFPPASVKPPGSFPRRTSSRGCGPSWRGGVSDGEPRLGRRAECRLPADCARLLLLDVPRREGAGTAPAGRGMRFRATLEGAVYISAPVAGVPTPHLPRDDSSRPRGPLRSAKLFPGSLRPVRSQEQLRAPGEPPAVLPLPTSEPRLLYR